MVIARACRSPSWLVSALSANDKLLLNLVTVHDGTVITTVYIRTDKHMPEIFRRPVLQWFKGAVGVAVKNPLLANKV